VGGAGLREKGGEVRSLDANWRKSSISSNDGSCVEVRRTVTSIEVRDTKDRGGPVLRFDEDAWSGFMAGVRGGEFDCG